jgi:uncharacterized UPF0160 family protein
MSDIFKERRVMRNLITHDGQFHADEVLATSLLLKIFPDAKIIRTRDAALIDDADPDDIVYDVGGVFDADANRFDHHQPGAPRRSDGAPLSAFGLIWDHFAEDYLRRIGIAEDSLAGVAGAIEASLVRGIDLLDNGALDPSTLGFAAGLTLPSLIADLNPSFDAEAPDAEAEAFETAVRLAGSALAARARHEASRLRARREVLDQVRARGDGRILELARGAPYRGALTEAGADDILFVVHPRKNDWVLAAVSRNEEGYERRRDLPEAWAGLEGRALAEATGVPDAIFCHRARFLAVAGSRDGALRLAELALQPEPSETPSL